MLNFERIVRLLQISTSRGFESVETHYYFGSVLDPLRDMLKLDAGDKVELVDKDGYFIIKKSEK